MLLNLASLWPTALGLYRLATWTDIPCCAWNVFAINSTIWDPLVATATSTLTFDYRVCEKLHSGVGVVSPVPPSKKYSVPECSPSKVHTWGQKPLCISLLEMPLWADLPLTSYSDSFRKSSVTNLSGWDTLLKTLYIKEWMCILYCTVIFFKLSFHLH